MLLLVLAVGTGVILLGDFVAASAAKRLGVSYGWYVPGSWALYLILGAVTAHLLSPLHAAPIGAAIGFIDGTVGSMVAYRVGVMHWKQPPNVLSLAAGGVLIALMCAVLTLLGAVWAARGLP